MKRIQACFLFLILPLPWIACSCKEAPAVQATSIVKEQPLVRVAQAVKRKMNRHIEVSGNILQSQKAAISPTVPGTIRRVYKREGDYVRKGEKLVELDSRDFRLVVEQASAGLRAARAGMAAAGTGLANLKVQYQRFLGLHQKNAVSQAEFEKVETGYKATQSKYEVAAAQVRLAEVGLKTASKKLADTVARAPFNGVVTQRIMDRGEMVRVMPPSVVLVIMNIDPVKAEGQVAERDLGSIRQGAPVEVMVDSLLNRRFKGEIEAVVPFVNPATRTAKVRVRIPNPKHVLKPGMAATIRIALAKREVLTVPREAIVSRNEHGKATVFVVADENRAHRREVTLDRSRQGPEAVVLGGLRHGEKVVVAGLADLSDGQQVRLDEKLPGPASQKAKESTKESSGAVTENAKEG